MTSKVSDIVVHPSYNDAKVDNDVAVWHLADSGLPQTEAINYVDLPTQGSDPAVGVDSTVAGWYAALQGKTMSL